jgi:hypothetical protein
VPGTLPLNALLGQTLAALTQDYERAGAGAGNLPTLGVWANVLRPVGDGIDVGELPAAARLSKRAVRAAIGAAEKRGWLVTEGRAVRLSPAGEAIRAAWPALDQTADRRWPELAEVLRPLVRHLYLEWPHYPAGYGPADDSATGGVYTAGGGQIDSKVPTHADDWAPVLRADVDGSSVAGLPLSALLSQALMAFTADFEELWIGGLHHAATVLRLLPDEGLPIKQLPLLSGLPGNGKSVLERHLYIEIVRDPNNSRVKLARPTRRGQNTRDEYEATVGRIEERWHPKYGDEVVNALRSSLETIVADLDTDLPHHVVGSLVFG